MKSELKILSLIFVTCIACIACSKEETYTKTIKGQDGNIVYINQGKTDNIQNLFCSSSIVHTPLTSFGYNLQGALPVRCAAPASQKLEVTFRVNNDLVSAYNQANGTNYSLVPSNAVEIGILKAADAEGNRALSPSMMLTIPTGNYISADSLVVRLKNESLSQLKDAKYMVALEVVSIKGNARLATNVGYNTAYMVIATQEKLINDAATLSDLTGTLCADRSSWVITSNNTTYSGNAANLLDGQVNTVWRLSQNNYTFTVDLSKTCNITALRFYTNYANNAYYRLNNAVVEYSTDGVEFKSGGSIAGTGMPLDGYYQNIIFYASISARYLRLTLTHMYNYGLAEFNIYEE